MDLTWMSVRAGWRRARVSSIIIALLIGITGGFAIAAASAARQVDSAFDSLLRQVDAPDLIVIPQCERTITGCDGPDNDAASALAQLADVDAVEQARLAEVVRPHLLSVEGDLLLATDDNPMGCFDGDRSLAMIPVVGDAPTDQAVPFRLRGRMPAPNSREVVLTRATARRVGLATGDEFVLAGWCTGDGDPVELDRPIRLVVSGLSTGPLDIEPPGSGISVEPTYVDPGVFKLLVEAGAETSLNSIVWLVDGSVEATTREIQGYGVVIDFDEQASNINGALDNDARPLWIMAIAGLMIGLLVLAPVIHRSVTGDAGDIAAIAGLGASRSQRAVHVAAHLIAVGATGLLLAVVLAPLIQPRLPLGLGAVIVADRAAGFDPTATAVGIALLTAALAAVIAVATWRSLRLDLLRSSPATAASRRPHSSVRLRPAGQTGLLAALGRPAGRRLASPWPGVVSLVLAVAVSVAGFTYVAGLRHFESTPRLTGWNWDMVVEIDGTAEARAATMERIENLEDVGAVTTGTGLYPPIFLEIPGTELQLWPWSFATGPGAITPSMTAGRSPQGPDEIAIDVVYSEFTGRAIGDTVVLSRPTLIEQIGQYWAHDLDIDVPATAGITATFEVTGLAVFSNDRTARFPQASFTQDGLGDLIAPSDAEIAAARQWLPEDLPDEVRAEVEAFLSDFDIDNRVAYIRASHDAHALAGRVEATPGVSTVFALQSGDVLSQLNGLNVVDNDRVPTTLAMMGLVASIALGTYLLVTGMFQRRSELSILRALGMSGTNITSSFAAQAIATVVMVGVVAIPVGLVAGQWSWTQFARDLDVVEEPVVPATLLAIGAVAAVAASVIVAAIVGRLVVRRSAAEQLRVE